MGVVTYDNHVIFCEWDGLLALWSPTHTRSMTYEKRHLAQLPIADFHHASCQLFAQPTLHGVAIVVMPLALNLLVVCHFDHDWQLLQPPTVLRELESPIQLVQCLVRVRLCVCVYVCCSNRLIGSTYYLVPPGVQIKYRNGDHIRSHVAADFTHHSRFSVPSMPP